MCVADLDCVRQGGGDVLCDRLHLLDWAGLATRVGSMRRRQSASTRVHAGMQLLYMRADSSARMHASMGVRVGVGYGLA